MQLELLNKIVETDGVKQVCKVETNECFGYREAIELGSELPIVEIGIDFRLEHQMVSVNIVQSKKSSS
jgi:hypothetical protein